MLISLILLVEEAVKYCDTYIGKTLDCLDRLELQNRIFLLHF